VLWISDDGIPDLGGTYEGDACFADEVRSFILFSQRLHDVLLFCILFCCLTKYYHTLQVIQPALTYPGAYRRISVELKVSIQFIGWTSNNAAPSFPCICSCISSADPSFGGQFSPEE
jgi:hypothetical protein